MVLGRRFSNMNSGEKKKLLGAILIVALVVVFSVVATNLISKSDFDTLKVAIALIWIIGILALVLEVSSPIYSRISRKASAIRTSRKRSKSKRNRK